MNVSTEGAVPPELNQSDYHYSNSELGYAHAYILPELIRWLGKVTEKGCPIFEIGAGNGSLANVLSELGYVLTGVEPSGQGVAIANQAYPHLKISKGSGYDDLAASHGTYPMVISIEVIEHVYAPRLFARRCFDLLEPGGYLILSTPYHGYWKNLALALTGRLDTHFTALWDHGHIKFWSTKTLSCLLEEAGFQDIEISRAGRIPPLAKSMIAVARKPAPIRKSTI